MANDMSKAVTLGAVLFAFKLKQYCTESYSQTWVLNFYHKDH